MWNITNLQINAVVEHRCQLGESPVWDAKRETILWVDVLAGEIHEYGLKNQAHRIISVHGMIGSVAVCKNGNFIAALKNGFAFIDRPSGKIALATDPEPHLPDNRFNDGKCDPAGRFLAGTMSLSGQPGAGSLYAFGKNGAVTKKIEQVSISNGMAWSLDYQTFYYIDTPTFEVVSYAYNVVTGGIRDKKVAIKISKEDGCPDGMTIDTNGMLWIAHWDGWQVTRWNPHTGKKLSTVRLPVAKVTSCTFGGENLQDLYITSASVGLSDQELKMQPLAGSLMVIKKIGFTGAPTFEF